MDRDDPVIGNRVMLTVIAEDPSDKAIYTRKTVAINLVDLNDNAPVFIDTTSVISLPEDYRLGRAFYHVKALDADKRARPTRTSSTRCGPRVLTRSRSTATAI